MKSYQQFFAELKRRHVFKVAAIYGAAAFILLQVADLLGQGLRLPETFLPFVTALVLIGFPFALIVAWAFELTPEGIQKTEAASPEEIEGIIAQPASSRWPAGLLAIAGAVALLGGAWWAGRSSVPGPDGAASADAGVASDADADGLRLVYGDLEEDERPSIAVLPFADMSPEGDQEYFSDGMTEEILNTLAKIRELRVSGRTSAFAYKDRNIDLRRIGEELGVRYVVEGSVRTDGDQLRITAQLIDTHDGSHLWTDQYDRTLESVFAIQTEIAESIAEELRVPLGLDDPTRLVDVIGDLEAYDLYLAGRSRMRERGASLPEAIRLFEAAIARDSTWAPAWAGLAEAKELELWYAGEGERLSRDTAQVRTLLAEAEAAGRRALALDPRNASAHVALGSVHRDRYEWEAGERWFREALALDPDNAEAHQQYAELLQATGRIADGVRAASRAAVLDPAPVRLNVLGWVLTADDRFAEARLAYEKAIAADPEFRLPSPRGNLGQLHYDTGNYDEAYRIWAELAERNDSREELDSWWDEWVSLLRTGRLEAFPDTARKYLDPVDWALLGYPDSAAVAYLEQAEDEGSALGISLVYAAWDPWMDRVRQEPALRPFLESRGIADLPVRRTPADEREVPEVLRNRPPAGTAP